MSGAGEKNADWAQAWVDEQREKLKSSATCEDDARKSNDDAPNWEQLSSEWFLGLEKLLLTGFAHAGVPLGWAREQQREWRDLAVAQAEYRKLEAELLRRFLTVQSQALDGVERSLRERAAENRPLEQVRELYDLWIERGEEAYGEIARSDGFCELQAAFRNAAVRLRACQQQILERGLKQFDLPTRAELNSAHRELRALRERLDRLQESHSVSTRRSKRSARAGRARAQKKTPR